MMHMQKYNSNTSNEADAPSPAAYFVSFFSGMPLEGTMRGDLWYEVLTKVLSVWNDWSVRDISWPWLVITSLCNYYILSVLILCNK